MAEKNEQDFINALRERVDNQKPKVISEKKGMDKQEAFLEGEYMLRKMFSEKKPATMYEAEHQINETMMDVMKYFKQVGVDIAPEEFVNYLKEKK